MEATDNYLDIRDVLIPTKPYRNVVNVNEIDTCEWPEFPEKVKLNYQQKALKAEDYEPAKTFVFANTTDEMPFKSEYVSPRGVLRTNIERAIKKAAGVPRNVPFEIFNQVHLNACEGLVQVLYFIGIKNVKTAITLARQYVNEDLLNYCINVVFRHRPEFVESGIQLPSHISTHPIHYVDITQVDAKLYEREAKKVDRNEPLVIEAIRDFTATDADPEHFLAYFREDIGLNLHHRHWHEVYPLLNVSKFIKMDRRGELFVYMHSQILARYNFERLCNGLEPVKKFNDFSEQIKEAYYPKLDEESQVKVWSPRQPLAQLRDVNREGINYELINLKRWLERLIDTIDIGYAKKMEDGKKVEVKLEEPEAINDLGNTIDAVEDLSYNYKYYGNLHTGGHIIIAYCHDPDNRFKEKAGVMGKLEVALRDPMFYRWHAFIDDVIDRYRKTLKAYGDEDKLFEKIEINSVEIDSNIGKPKVIQTFWQKDQVEITNGILSLNDPENAKMKKRPSQVCVKFNHLQHEDFVYKFKVTNKRCEEVTGVIRVFMAPALDETRSKMHFNKLRRFMIELDKFTHTLQPGENEFIRESRCSSVTIPFEQTFMTIKSFNKEEQKRDYGYCGCGWPHHLLIGRGRQGGYPCTLFVMITDYEKDKVIDSSMEKCERSKSSISYCGVRSKKYPDRRPMGFPFDRPADDSTTEVYLENFATISRDEFGTQRTPVKNMFIGDFVIDYNPKREINGPTIPVATATVTETA